MTFSGIQILHPDDLKCMQQDFLIQKITQKLLLQWLEFLSLKNHEFLLF